MSEESRLKRLGLYHLKDKPEELKTELDRQVSESIKKGLIPDRRSPKPEETLNEQPQNLGQNENLVQLLNNLPKGSKVTIRQGEQIEENHLGQEEHKAMNLTDNQKISTTLKFILWIIVLIIISVWFIQNRVENNRLREVAQTATRDEEKRIEDTILANIETLTQSYEAKTDWVKLLNSAENYSSSQLFTVDLERAWITGKPILFFGKLQDVATLNQKQYLVRIEKNYWAYLDYHFSSELWLHLRVEKKLIDNFLASNPALLKGDMFGNGIAIAAIIDEIRTEKYMTFSDGESSYTDVKIGVGELLGMVYTGDVRFETK